MFLRQHAGQHRPERRLRPVRQARRLERSVRIVHVYLCLASWMKCIRIPSMRFSCQLMACFSATQTLTCWRSGTEGWRTTSTSCTSACGPSPRCVNHFFQAHNYRLSVCSQLPIERILGAANLCQAPLVIGCDVTRVSKETLGILSNAEVIAINQGHHSTMHLRSHQRTLSH